MRSWRNHGRKKDNHFCSFSKVPMEYRFGNAYNCCIQQCDSFDFFSMRSNCGDIKIIISLKSMNIRGDENLNKYSTNILYLSLKRNRTKWATVLSFLNLRTFQSTIQRAKLICVYLHRLFTLRSNWRFSKKISPTWTL